MTELKRFPTAASRFSIALALACVFGVPGLANATTRTVTSLNDDGGVNTLRTLIAASVDGDTINFSFTGTITLTSGELAIGRNLTILGPVGGMTISGNNLSRVFNISAGTVNLSDLTIANGRIVGSNGSAGAPAGNAVRGGGIINSGILNLTNCNISGNSVAGGNGFKGGTGISGVSTSGGAGGTGRGGGILNQNIMTLINCTFSGNSSTGGLGGDGEVDGSVILSANAGRGGAASGGGIGNQSLLTAINCTFNGNSCQGGHGGRGGYQSTRGGNGGNGGPASGGGIDNSNMVALSDCTFSGNSVSGGDGDLGGGSSDVGGAGASGEGGFGGSGGTALGGGLNSSGGSVHSTIVAGNVGTGGGAAAGGSGFFYGSNGSTGTSNGPDVNGSVNSQGYNLIGRTDGSSGWVGSDLRGSTALPLNPLLGPLQDNGGPTYTMALLPNSAAIDAGDDAVTQTPYNLITDQRGRPRKSGAHVDIGAAEISPITLVVTNNNDTGPGSLRQTILDASRFEGDTITFAPAVTGPITLATGELLLNKNITIAGPGATNLVISGNTSSRVFEIASGTVNISGITIQDGFAGAGIVGSGQPGQNIQGGGILNNGTLGLTACVISNNTVIGGRGGAGSTTHGGSGGAGQGGGIANLGVLTLTNCAVRGNFVVGGHGGNASGNQASGPGGVGSGGGIYNVNSLVLSACTLDANSTTYGSGGTGGLGESIPGAASGGGLANPTGNATLYTSTIANNIVNGNGSTGGGGGIFSQGTLVIYNATISGNSGDASGGGVNGNGQIRDTLIAGNTAFASPDVAGAFTTAGYNLIGAIDGSSGFANGVNHDQAGTQASPLNPLLGSLASNGGLTPTMALLTGSPAIDKGNRFGLVTDQRGQLRPYDFAGIGNAAGGDGSDIGAFELNLPILNVARSANQVVLSWPVSDTGYTLQFKTNLTLSIAWSNVLGAPILIGSKHFMTNSGASGNKFYRLAK